MVKQTSPEEAGEFEEPPQFLTQDERPPGCHRWHLFLESSPQVLTTREHHPVTNTTISFLSGVQTVPTDLSRAALEGLSIRGVHLASTCKA